jgi:hypothetical protein
MVERTYSLWFYFSRFKESSLFFLSFLLNLRTFILVRSLSYLQPLLHFWVRLCTFILILLFVVFGSGPFLNLRFTSIPFPPWSRGMVLSLGLVRPVLGVAYIAVYRFLGYIFWDLCNLVLSISTSFFFFAFFTLCNYPFLLRNSFIQLSIFSFLFSSI